MANYMNSTDVEKVKALLTPGKKIVITTHSNPDGDAMGSSLALFHYLKKKGCSPVVIVPTDYPDFLAWMPGDEAVIIYPKKTAMSNQLITEAEIIFCLDFNALSRTGDMENPLRQSGAVKIVIDHHIAPDNFPDFLFSDVSLSSTAEMVYDFIVSAGDEPLIDRSMGTCLYAGIVTDTGGFQFPVTSPKVHRIAALLIEKGVNNSEVYEKIFNQFTESRLRLFGYCLVEKMKLFKELKTGLITLNREELQRFNVTTGDTEGLVNYPLKIEDINFAALIIDRTEKIKLSFRSKGSFDVNAFARKHFNGGGHKNAAGGQSNERLEAVVKKFEEVILHYRNELNY
ncbi:MAG TPA: bifunctional oligoribonuclease/PAP phosphatase NrnA [Chitinophagales bacterium]|nr:bifunctional oligoribonuclease/PAP phosphatase NrnA [Chitinophagales bacterium]